MRIFTRNLDRSWLNMKPFSLLILLLALLPASAQPGNYVNAPARPGDGALSLLEAYGVETPCNTAHFYQINGLRKNQGLVAGKSYLLPIVVYAYNGKSIRSTTGNTDLEWAERIQQFNDQLHRAGLKPGDYRQDRQLWVPWSRLNCPGEAEAQAGPAAASAGRHGPMPSLPVKNQPLRGTYPIFGEKYAPVPLESTELSGCVYYISSGHGGPDPGAVGKFMNQSLCEDEYAYDVSLRLARNLLAQGATVYIIVRDGDDGIREGEILPCDKDETFWLDTEIPIPQSERLTLNSDIINDLYRKNVQQGVRYQRLIVIHVDSNSQKEQIDMFFYHKAGDEAGQRFAERIHATIGEKYDIYRKGRGYSGTVSSRDLHMLRETDSPAVFIELGNIRNRNDQARLVIEGNRQLVADWLTEGLIRDAARR
jgi:N-acetylmuramoyl-L-alanine amidase